MLWVRSVHIKYRIGGRWIMVLMCVARLVGLGAAVELKVAWGFALADAGFAYLCINMHIDA